MATERKWIQATTVAVDEDSSALLVNLGYRSIRGKSVTVDETAVRLQTLVTGGVFDPTTRRVEIQNCDSYLDMGWAVADSQPSGANVMGVIPPGLIVSLDGSAIELADVWIIGGKTDHRAYVLECGGAN